MTTQGDWTRKRGDRHPSLIARLTQNVTNVDGVASSGPFDLTSATAVHIIITPAAVDLSATTPATLIEAVQVTVAVTGDVQYDLTAAFAALPWGTYHTEFEVLFGDGTRETFPDDKSKPYSILTILADLGDG